MHTSQFLKMRTRIFGFWSAGTAEFFEKNVFEGGTACHGGDETPWKLFGSKLFFINYSFPVDTVYIVHEAGYLVPPVAGTKLIKNENCMYHSSCTNGTCHNLLNFAYNVGLTESPIPVHRYSN